MNNKVDLQWIIRSDKDDGNIALIKKQFNVTDKVAQLYEEQGFYFQNDLDPELELPNNWPELNQAAEKIIWAIKNKKLIKIHGDYDADGLTGTALLYLGLNELGATLKPYVPKRSDGYGVSIAKVKEHSQSDLFITVDTGIKAVEALTEISKNGTEIILTDHHSYSETLPPGIIVHPAFSEAFKSGPFPSGAGVAFILLWKVYDIMGLPFPIEYNDLAAIGTIADLVPLRGFNRALVKRGLKQLKFTKHLGLKLLLNKIAHEAIDSDFIAYKIAPIINSPGRISNPNLALSFLLTEKPDLARDYSQKIIETNEQRKILVQNTWDRVYPNIKTLSASQFLVDNTVPPGIAGLLAARMSQESNLASIVITEGHGSIRSPNSDIDLNDILPEVSRFLITFGGHTAAAGFTIAEDNISNFMAAFDKEAKQFPISPPSIKVFGQINHNDAAKLYEALEKLEPFGAGNPKPIFLVSGIPQEIQNFSNDRFARFNIDGIECISFSPNLPKVEETLAIGFLTKDKFKDSNYKIIVEDFVAKSDSKTKINKSSSVINLFNSLQFYYKTILTESTDKEAAIKDIIGKLAKSSQEALVPEFKETAILMITAYACLGKSSITWDKANNIATSEWKKYTKE